MGILDFFIKRRSNKSNSELNVPKYVSYFDATPEQKANLTKYVTDNRSKYTIDDHTNKKQDRNFDVIEQRYKGLYKSAKDNGLTEEEIDRLMPFMLSQTVLEHGYELKNKNNNFGGIKFDNGETMAAFKTPEEFYDFYIKNLDKRWGDEYLGEGKGWRHAKTLKEYADTLNREDLGLHTEEAYEKHKKENPDHPAYIYTPLWKNHYTTLDSGPKLGGIYPRVNNYYKLLKQRVSEFDKQAKDNNWVIENNNDDTKKYALGGSPILKWGNFMYPNIKSGGYAIPLGDNKFYIKGNKHSEGGVDVGKDLEVEGEEVMKLGGKSIKVYSAVPMINGKSPAQLVLEGKDDDKVFKAQERYKDIHKLNDDGTRKARYGMADTTGENETEQVNEKELGEYLLDKFNLKYGLNLNNKFKDDKPKDDKTKETANAVGKDVNGVKRRYWNPEAQPFKFRSDSLMTDHTNHNPNKKVFTVVHHTATDNVGAVESEFTRGGEDRKSANVVIKKNGDRIVFVDHNEDAWHAGKNKEITVAGKRIPAKAANNYSVGIEFMGNTDFNELTKEQIESYVEYMKATGMPLDPEHVLTHGQINNEKHDITLSERDRLLEETNNSKKRLGGTQNMKKVKMKDGGWFDNGKITEAGKSGFTNLGLGLGNVALGLTSGLLEHYQNKKYKAPSEMTPLQRAYLQRVNNDYERRIIDEETDKTINAISNNTSSSRDDIRRILGIRNNAASRKIQSYAAEQNINRQIGNQENLYNTNIRNTEIGQTLGRKDAITAFGNQLIDKNITNANNMITNIAGAINSGVQGYFGNKARNEELDAILASTPHGERVLRERGSSWTHNTPINENNTKPSLTPYSSVISGALYNSNNLFRIPNPNYKINLDENLKRLLGLIGQ